MGLNYRSFHNMLSMSYPGTNQVLEDGISKSGAIFHLHNIWSRFSFMWTSSFSFSFFLKSQFERKLSWHTTKGMDAISLSFCIRLYQNYWAHSFSFIWTVIKPILIEDLLSTRCQRGQSSLPLARLTALLCCVNKRGREALSRVLDNAQGWGGMSQRNLRTRVEHAKILWTTTTKMNEVIREQYSEE